MIYIELIQAAFIPVNIHAANYGELYAKMEERKYLREPFFKRTVSDALLVGLLVSTMSLLHAEEHLIQLNEGIYAAQQSYRSIQAAGIAVLHIKRALSKQQRPAKLYKMIEGLQ